MKKLTILLFIALSFGTFAQSTDIGIKGGLNYAYIHGSDAINVSPSFTYHAGAFLKIGFTDFVAIQPEFLFSVKGSDDDSYSVDLNYLDLPILLKVKLGDMFSLHAGPQLSYLLSTNEDGVSLVKFEEQIKDFDLGVAGGFELEMESGFSLGARYSFSVESIGTDYETTQTVTTNGVTSTVKQNIEAPDYKNGVIQLFAAFTF